MTQVLEDRESTGCSVEIACVGDEWLVRIVDNGRQITQRFSVASHARAFADGQKIRLGLCIFREPQSSGQEGKSGGSLRLPD